MRKLSKNASKNVLELKDSFSISKTSWLTRISLITETQKNYLKNHWTCVSLFLDPLMPLFPSPSIVSRLRTKIKRCKKKVVKSSLYGTILFQFVSQGYCLFFGLSLP